MLLLAVVASHSVDAAADLYAPPWQAALQRWMEATATASPDEVVESAASS